MVRKKKEIVIDAKLYKHFAIATVGITVVIALIADGERRQAVSERAQEIQAYAEKEKGPFLVINTDVEKQGPSLEGFYLSETPKVLNPKPVDGAQMPTGAAVNRLALLKEISDEQLAQLGISRQQLMNMSPREQEAILTQLNGGINPVPSEEMVERMTRESLARSGGDGLSADY